MFFRGAPLGGVYPRGGEADAYAAAPLLPLREACALQPFGDVPVRLVHLHPSIYADVEGYGVFRGGAVLHTPLIGD